VLDAVTSALAQSERDIEVLVIDDGSTDDSVRRLATLSDPRLTVLEQANAGLSTTLNRGLERARGRWLKFLPSDDALHPACIARQLAAADAAPDARLVFALPAVVDARGEPLADPAPQAWFDSPFADREQVLRGLLERNFLSAPAALFDRELALAVGGFDATLVVAQDYDLWLKMLVHAPLAFVHERLVRVRWHGANQSAVVTPESEAERARVVIGALERMGLERWIELFRADAARDPVSDASARAALAGALRRSGLHQVAPIVERLVADVAAPEPSPVQDRRRARRALGAALRSVVARLAPARTKPLPVAVPIVAGPRLEHWLLVAPARAGAASRAAHVAGALARAGAVVTLATPPDDPAHGDVAGPDVRRVTARLAALRELLRDHDQRLRVVVPQPDGELVAFAREARLAGARVVYDKGEGWGALARAAVDSEHALIDAADDLVGATRPIVKQLAASRRLVHLLPDAPDAAGWRDVATSLRLLTAQPTLTVAVLCAASHDAGAIAACLAALAAGRGDLPYRIAVVDDGVSAEVLAGLVERDEALEVTLLRNALRGRASGYNLALRATSSELVVLLDASRRAPGPGWLDDAIAALLARRELGAVVARDSTDDAGSGWAWLAPRAVLAGVAGFDEAYDPASLEDPDMAQRLAARGYVLADWGALGPVPDHAEGVRSASSEALRRAERHFRRKWRRGSHPGVGRGRMV